jgi:hypothetical protein
MLILDADFGAVCLISAIAMIMALDSVSTIPFALTIASRSAKVLGKND